MNTELLEALNILEKEKEISKETLLDAQKNPSEYKDLLVRVAGYSAYFVELSKGLQDDIIGRTELNFA